MPKSVQIAAPPLSHREIAERLGIPKTRRKALQAILDDAKAAFQRQTELVEPEKRRKRASAA